MLVEIAVRPLPRSGSLLSVLQTLSDLSRKTHGLDDKITACSEELCDVVGLATVFLLAYVATGIYDVPSKRVNEEHPHWTSEEDPGRGLRRRSVFCAIL